MITALRHCKSFPRGDSLRPDDLPVTFLQLRRRNAKAARLRARAQSIPTTLAQRVQERTEAP